MRSVQADNGTETVRCSLPAWQSQQLKSMGVLPCGMEGLQSATAKATRVTASLNGISHAEAKEKAAYQCSPIPSEDLIGPPVHERLRYAGRAVERRGRTAAAGRRPGEWS
mmetsp:Transcript_83035/g.230616  ORF Transcript_83035/g.230616 Transcript_83035/m.230616 type:complete len:110 (+) Transcript_83035:79-408(+)